MPGNKVQALIHNIKYSGFRKAGIYFGKLLGNRLHSDERINKFDYILPVPLHNAKLRERGYNQAYLIAQGLSETLNIKISENFLIRKKNTESQTRLSVSERQKNVKDAFEILKVDNYRNNKFIIVDDVITSGATIKEIRQLLFNYGIQEIFIVSLAIAR